MERKLRGDYHNTHNTWVCFDPQLYHALEEVTSGNRVSIALFTSKGWNKLTHNCMDELIDIGFYPPHSALSTDAGPTSSTAAASPNSIHTSSRATPTGSIATSTLTLADPLVRDVSSTSLLSSGAYILVPPGDDNIDFLVYRASIPARLPPATKIDELTGTHPLPPLPSRPTIFDRPMQDRMVEEEMTRNPLDLDP